MKPGIVLISFTQMRASSSRKKSTRASPAASIARNAATASRRNSAVSSGVSGAGMTSLAMPSVYFAS